MRANEATGKFAPDGTALPYPGTTIICSVDPDSREGAALTRVRDALQCGAWADKFAFLPPDTYHMTVYRGVNHCRRFPDEWPDGIALEASLDQVTREFAKRLRGVPLAAGFSLRPVGLEQCASGESQLFLEGATPEEAASLEATRAAIGRALRHSRPGEASYRLHLTFSYLVGQLTAEEQAGLDKCHREAYARLATECPVIRVSGPRLCRYDTMLAYRPVGNGGIDDGT